MLHKWMKTAYPFLGAFCLMIAGCMTVVIHGDDQQVKGGSTNAHRRSPRLGSNNAEKTTSNSGNNPTLRNAPIT
jgi:hypothetical protein